MPAAPAADRPVAETGDGIAGSAAPQPAAPAPAPSRAAEEAAPAYAAPQAAAPAQPPPEPAQAAPAAAGQAGGIPAAATDLERVKSRWGDFVNTLRGVGSSGSLDAFLRSACEPEAIEGDTLVLAFYYQFHKSKIEDPKYATMVERKLGEMFGSPRKIRCVLREQDAEPRRKVEDIPLVKAALEHGARIASVVEDPPQPAPSTEGEE